MSDETGSLSPGDCERLTTCLNCSGSRFVPDIYGDYVFCPSCSVLPREPG